LIDAVVVDDAVLLAKVRVRVMKAGGDEVEDVPVDGRRGARRGARAAMERRTAF